MIEELEDVEDGDVTGVIGQVDASVALKEMDVLVAAAPDEGVAVVNFALVVVETSVGGVPSALAEIESMDAHATADVE